MRSKAAPREPGINAFRIFNLTLVILAHAWFFGGPTEHGDPRRLILIIAQCSVPTFFLTSGYLLRWKEGDAFAVTRWCCRKLLPLFAVWVSLYVLIAWVDGQGSLWSLLMTVPLGGPTRHLWFLLALTLALSVVSVSLRLAGTRFSWSAAAVLAVAGLWCGTYQQWAGLEAHSIYSGILTAPLFVLIGNRLAQWNPPRWPVVFGMAVAVGYLLQVWDDRLIAAAPGYRPDRAWMVSIATVPYAVAVFLFARSLNGRIVQKLASLRPYFATIYCIHPMILMGFGLIVKPHNFALMLGITLATLALSILAAIALPASAALIRERMRDRPPLRVVAQR